MTIRYEIAHITEYAYSDPVSVSHNEARLRPRALPYQRIVRDDLEITPVPSASSRFSDYFGNAVDYFELCEPVDVLRVRSVSVVERSRPPVEPARSVAWDVLLQSARDPRLAEFRLDSSLVRRSEAFRAYAESSFHRGRPVLEAVRDLTRRVHADFKFDTTATEVHTPVEEVLASRAGVCQDFAHVEIACLRSMGLAVRYVSGYLRTRPPPGRERLVGADASHAWVAVHCGDDDWIDFDPTNDVIPECDHITVGWGRDYADVPPVTGVLVGGGTTVLRVSVDVATVEETRQEPAAS